MEEVNSWDTEGNGKKVWYWIVEIEILKGMVGMQDIDDEIEIDGHGYGESCMTLEYICTIARW